MAKVKAPAAKVTFQAFAYLGKYTSLERVVSGQEMPLICKEEGGYFLEQGCPIIGTIECTLTLYSADKVVQNQIEALQRQIEWFKRQVFGRKSERFAPEPEPQQMHLGQVLGEVLGKG